MYKTTANRHLIMTATLIAVAAAIAAALGLFTQSALAIEPVQQSQFKGTFTAYVSPDDDFFVVKGAKKFSAVKSSKPAIATVEKDGAKKLYVEMKKAGTTKVSYKYGGKQFSVTLNIKKYTNPVSAFKIGATNLAAKFKKSTEYTSAKGLGGKLNIKAKAGWKIKQIEVDGKTIKNGKKIPASTAFVFVTMQNKSTKGTIELFYSYMPEA